MTDPEPHHDLHEALGRAIRARRAECGMTLRDLGQLTAISYSYLAEIERGTSGKQVSTDKLVKIAEALGIPPSELLGRGEQLRDSTVRRARQMRSPSSELLPDFDAGFDAPSADAAPALAMRISAPHSPVSDDDQQDANELRWQITQLIEGAEIEDLRVIASLARELRHRAAELERRMGTRRKRR